MRELMKNAERSDFIRLGFIQEEDGSGDCRGTTWEMKNDKFHIVIDAWFDVTLSRLNPDTDTIEVKIDDLHDLEMLIAFIQD